MGLRYLFLALMLPFLPVQATAPAAPAPAPSSAPAPVPTPVVSAEPVVKAAVDLLRSEMVARSEIYYLPTEIETPARMGPEDLEKYSYYRISIDEREQESKLRQDLASALATSYIVRAATGPGTKPDCRWGCVFLDANGKRLLTMYFEGHGWGGLIGGTPVTGIGPVVETLQRRCSSLWK